MNSELDTAIDKVQRIESRADLLQKQVVALVDEILQLREIHVTWERRTRRLLALGDFGFRTEFFDKSVDDADFLSDEWLTRWYNEPLPHYIIEALHEADNAVLATTKAQYIE